MTHFFDGCKHNPASEPSHCFLANSGVQGCEYTLSRAHCLRGEVEVAQRFKLKACCKLRRWNDVNQRENDCSLYERILFSFLRLILSGWQGKRKGCVDVEQKAVCRLGAKESWRIARECTQGIFDKLTLTPCRLNCSLLLAIVPLLQGFWNNTNIANVLKMFALRKRYYLLIYIESIIILQWDPPNLTYVSLAYGFAASFCAVAISLSNNFSPRLPFHFDQNIFLFPLSSTDDLLSINSCFEAFSVRTTTPFLCHEIWWSVRLRVLCITLD